MDSHNSFLDIHKYVDFWISLNELWISKNHNEFWISIIRFMDILNSFLDILNSEYLWISINRIMDIHKLRSDAILLFIPYLWISINHFWISKNRAELRISIIHFRISINRLMDIQYSSYLRIFKNELWIPKNQFVFMDIHNSFLDIHKSIYGYLIFN